VVTKNETPLDGTSRVSLELDQDGLAAGEDSTGVTGLVSVVGTGAMVGDSEPDVELHAPTNSAAATMNMARTAFMTGSPRAWGFESAYVGEDVTSASGRTRNLAGPSNRPSPETPETWRSPRPVAKGFAAEIGA
jgi:hypothetical protein